MTKVCSYYEAKSDEQIIVELGRRLNPEVFGAWESDIDWLNWYLHANSGTFAASSEEKVAAEDAGVPPSLYKKSYEELVHQGGYDYDEFNSTYYKYAKGMLRPDGSLGFATPSGRIELTPLTYKAWGLRTTPFHTEPIESPISTPELMQEYPLILTCGGRSFEFFHSEHRQLPTMRELHPWPLVQINPATAERYGIKNGEWVWIETDRGRFRQKAKLTPIVNESTIHAEHGWWFPETSAELPNLFGTFDSNPNNCTRAFETGQGGVGSSIKSMICKIYPYRDGDTLPSEQVVEMGGWNVVHPGQA
jgi:anaerobic selenocysteine-containing dehydrogenase